MLKNPPAILAIETSSEQASVALLINGTISQQTTNGVTNHSQAILPMVQALLQQAGIVLADCQAIAFGSGPGSFTGVRTACGVVQGLAFGAGLPVIPVVTLLALAEQARISHGACNVVCALDARMSEVYWAQYQFDVTTQHWNTLVPPTLCAPAQVLPLDMVDVSLCGNGFAAYAGQFTLPSELVAHHALPEAQDVARLAAVEFAAGRMLAAEQAQPLYLRNKIALTMAERRALTA